jgi:hypothetical protein
MRPPAYPTMPIAHAHQLSTAYVCRLMLTFPTLFAWLAVISRPHRGNTAPHWRRAAGPATDCEPALTHPAGPATSMRGGHECTAPRDRGHGHHVTNPRSTTRPAPRRARRHRRDPRQGGVGARPPRDSGRKEDTSPAHVPENLLIFQTWQRSLFQFSDPKFRLFQT